MTISVIFIKFLKNLVCPIPYLVDWNRILCVSVLCKAARCHGLGLRLTYFKLFVVTRWEIKKLQNNLYLILVLTSNSVKSETFYFLLQSLFYKQSPATLGKVLNTDFHVRYSQSFIFYTVKWVETIMSVISHYIIRLNQFFSCVLGRIWW